MGSADNLQILLDTRAERDLKKIKFGNPQVLPHISKALDSLAQDPLQGKPLKGNKKGCYSLRIGVYRVIYEIDLLHNKVYTNSHSYVKEIN